MTTRALSPRTEAQDSNKLKRTKGFSNSSCASVQSPEHIGYRATSEPNSIKGGVEPENSLQTEGGQITPRDTAGSQQAWIRTSILQNSHSS